MNTAALKRFAQQARRKLREQTAARLDHVLHADSPELREQAAAIAALRKALHEKGRDQLLEEAAYTWFNRLVALRYMDVNGFQPLGVMVVTPEEGRLLPELLNRAKEGLLTGESGGVDERTLERIYALLDGKMPSPNPQNEAYRLLLVGACNALHRQLPFLFERIHDWTELLLPDDLTSTLSIVHDVVQGMPADDCRDVEVIGWLYQFYISEKKDEVFASKAKVKKEDIPAATQLFTPRWIVEYMVQNTLGKLWIQNRPGSRLREHMPYFIESASLQSGDFLRISSPEELTLLDQACGSGHILVYGFDLLTRMYEEEGYSPSDIPRLILEKNLFGFEIDERAAQLASLALVMKARSYSRGFFRKAVPVPHILLMEDVKFAEGELEQYLQHMKLSMFSQDLLDDLRQFEQATNVGSLLRTRTANLPIVQQELPRPDIFLLDTHHKVQAAFRQMALLGRKFHCVVDNPPYMGGGNMNPELSAYVKQYYPDSKADLMACFMEAGWQALLPKGYLGMINQHSWMFLSSYEKLRETLIEGIFFDTMLHLGPRTFPEIGGEVVQNAAFTFWNKKPEGKGTYLRLVDEGSSEGKRTKTLEAIQNPECGWRYTANQKDFEKIPGSPIGYWLSESIFHLFESLPSLSKLVETRVGLDTGDNLKFIRFWIEVDFKKLIQNSYSKEDFWNKGGKWVPHTKGGDFRRWYGNFDYVLKFDKIAFDQLANSGNKLPSRQFYFREGISWSRVSSGKFAVRFNSIGFVFNSACPTGFKIKVDIIPFLGILNSKLVEYILFALNPTINFQSGSVRLLPIHESIISDNILIQLVNNSIEISKTDWDSRETSWDFPQSELLRLRGQDLEESYDGYCQYWTKKFHQLHRNEEELNRQFIEIYGLQDELTPDVPLEDITILKEETRIEQGQLVFDAQEVMAQFVSYAVGCMMGRYSLDKEGLILANQGETLADYYQKVLGVSELGISEEPLTANSQQLIANLSFLPDEDAIIPVLDDEWFEDDIVGRFHAFLRAAFGERDFRRNLAFLEAKLGKDIRKYFVKDFYAGHVQRYKKRPIYWLFSSPKGSFNVLVYLHRYTPDTMGRLLNDYVRPYLDKLRATRRQLDVRAASGEAAAIRKGDRLDRMIRDVEHYERDILYPLAAMRIALDLDDGVLVNYNKLGRAVAEVKGLNDPETKKKVRGFDWIDREQIR